MEPKTKKRVLIGSAVVVLLGVGGYLFYRWRKKKKEEEEEKKRQEEANKLTVNTGNQPVIVQGGGSSLIANPFKSKDELIAFQKYVIETKKDTDILGKRGADGDWGPKSQAAYTKYYADYVKDTNKPPVDTKPQPTKWPANAIPVGTKLYFKAGSTSVGLYSYPDIAYIVGTYQKKDVLDKSIGTITGYGVTNSYKIKPSLPFDNIATKTKHDGSEVYVWNYDITDKPF